MALPRIEAVITADTKQAEAGFDRVERGLHGVGDAAHTASNRSNQFSRRLSTGVSSTRRFQMGVQNASFQIGDFATQVGAGTNASIALGQQLPQLLGGFGVLGAVLGAVVAVGVPLTRVFMGMADEGRDLTSVLGTLQPAAEKVGDAFRAMADFGIVVAEAIVNNLDRILIIGATVATFFAGRWVAALVAARIATLSMAGVTAGLTAALVTLKAVLIRTGIGALVVAAGELVFQFTRLVSAAGSFGEAVGLIGDVFSEVWGRIKLAFENLPAVMDAAVLGMKASFLGGLESMLQSFQDFMNQVVGGLNSTFNMQLPYMDMEAIRGVGTGSLSKAARAAEGEAATASAGLEDLGITGPLESVQKIRDLLASIKDDRITLPDLLGAGGDDEEGEGGGKKKDPVTERLGEQEEALKAVKQQGRDTYSALAGFLQQFAGKSKAAAIAVVAINKAMAIAQAIQNTAVAVTKALTIDPTGALAARTALLGKVQIGLIAATGLAEAAGAGGGGGGGGGGAAGGFGGGAPAAQAAPRQNTTITLVGDVFSGDKVAELLNEFADRGGRLQENILVRRA